MNAPSKRRKMKVIPKVAVSEMPFFEGKISRNEKRKWGAMCATGSVNYYRVTFMQGHGGSRKEETWNKAAHIHTCCQSKVPWRHKKDCPRTKLD